MASLAPPKYHFERRYRSSSLPWLWIALGSTLLHVAVIALLRDWTPPPPSSARSTPIEVVTLPATKPGSKAAVAPKPSGAAAPSQPAKPATTPTAPSADLTTAAPAQPAAIAPTPQTTPTPVPQPLASTPPPSSPPPSSPPTPAPTAAPAAAPEPAPPPVAPTQAASPPAAPAPAESDEPLPPPPSVPTAPATDRQANLPGTVLPAERQTTRGVSLRVVAMWHHHAAISVPPEQLPSPVENPNLNYSPRFRSAAGRQTVTLEVVVSQNGKLKEVIEIKDEPEPELAQYAKELVAQIQFPQLAPADRSVTDNRISLEVRLAPL